MKYFASYKGAERQKPGPPFCTQLDKP